MERLSGELFDLTITSLNNDFGWEKAKYSLEFGLSTPISKFIEELERIKITTTDAKSNKRNTRLKFLQFFSGNTFFEEYFMNMMCFLNGGFPFAFTPESRHAYNKIVINIAGGNIFIVFAKLIKDLLGFAKSKYDLNSWQLSTFNYNYFINQKDNVQYGLRTFGGIKKWNEVLQFLNNYQNKQYLLDQFSDFDYCLVPNKPNSAEEQDEALSKLDEYYKKNRDSQGFILLRVKTLIKNNAVSSKGYTNKYGVSSCKYFKYFMEQTNMITPNIEYMAQMIDYNAVQEFKQNMQRLYQNKSSLQINNSEFDKKYQICDHFLDYLLRKKNSIAEETQSNVITAIETYIYGYSHQVSVSDGRVMANSEKLAPVKGAPRHQTLNAAMRYLHNVTSNLNTYILYWENGRFGVNRGRYPKHDSLENFKSLDAITNSANSKLLYLGSYLLQVFLNGPQLHTEQILDSILANHQQDDIHIIGTTSLSMAPSQLTLVPSTTALGKMNDSQKQSRFNLTRIKSFLEKGMYSELGYPDGINITINSITTTNTDTKSEKDLIDDITNGLAMISVTANQHNIPLESRPSSVDLNSDSEANFSPDSSPYYQWQYSVNDGWENYSLEDNALINEAFQNNPHGGLWLRFGDTDYDINFEQMTQTNNTTGFQREITWYEEGKASGIKKSKPSATRKHHKKNKKSRKSK